MSQHEYKIALVSQLESSVAFLDRRCLSLRKAPEAVKAQAYREWSSARDQLARARAALEASK